MKLSSKATTFDTTVLKEINNTLLIVNTGVQDSGCQTVRARSGSAGRERGGPIGSSPLGSKALKPLVMVTLSPIGCDHI